MNVSFYNELFIAASKAVSFVVGVFTVKDLLGEDYLRMSHGQRSYFTKFFMRQIQLHIELKVKISSKKKDGLISFEKEE